MSYTHFTLDERTFLQQLFIEGHSLRTIAAYLGRNVSSISRELSRNSIDNTYSSYKANELARSRGSRNTPCAIDPGSDAWRYVVDKLNHFWTPEQIACRWKKDHPRRKPISCTTIYRYINRGYLPQISRETHLRRRGKPAQSDKQIYNSVKPDRLIKEWPSTICKRSRVGDWEGDTILGGTGKGLAITLVDRKSRFLIGTLSPTKKSSVNVELISNILKDQPVESISFDNGVEFTEYHYIEKMLNTKVYFAERHKPWQRGTNENTNGLLRFFFKKGCDFNEISEEEFQKVVELINNRPRKCLGWKTPAEVYSKCCTCLTT